jgi:nucleoredoxin
LTAAQRQQRALLVPFHERERRDTGKRTHMALVKLLGEKLKTKDGEVSTAEALKGKQAVALYFSAHWCPPCRGFTPKLAEAYTGLVAAGKSFEIVFVSSDREESAFEEYFGEQPWLALPYAERKLKAALSKKFKVSGIPSLIILDGETGELITKDGREAVMDDLKGENFPWKPPTVWEVMGDEFMSADGEAVELSELRGEGKVLGLYFSAHWCPPCKAFTPLLVETYKKLKAAGKELEVVFVSSDRDMGQFQEYFATMPWLAIPPGDKRKAALSARFEVEGIPALVLLDGATGETINANGRGAVGGDPEGAEFPWRPKALNDMASGADGLNDEACVCVMMEGAPAESQAVLAAAMGVVAEAAKAAGGEELYFVARATGQVADQVRKLTKLGEAGAAPQLAILDIPDEGGFYVYEEEGAVDADSIASFVAKYKAGGLERKQLG